MQKLPAIRPGRISPEKVLVEWTWQTI